ncbi:MAG: diguanylate cyclase response regulator [Rhodospirillales bacterium]|nr:diguanylate cyclase response regulator [Rhodospirillales bacterium]
MIAGFRILVICNAFDDAEGLGSELLCAGYNVSLHWANAEASLRIALGEGNFDLVLCDNQTTNLDIITARGLIKEYGHDFPFIVISNAMTPEAQQIASQMKAGVDDFVEWGKPEHLVPAVERALRTSESRRQNLLAEQEMHYRANFDSLTDLPNRTLMLDRLSQAMKKARRDNTGVLLMFLDLDHFKTINDSMGHLAGDLLLEKAARRILSCLRDTDTAARIGGDEFAIILPDAHQRKTAEVIAAKLLKVLSDPFDLDSRQASISASIGITMFPDDGEDADILLRNADLAMYAAKRSGRNAFKVFCGDHLAGAIESHAAVYSNMVGLNKAKRIPMPVKYGLALAATLALAIFASTWLTSILSQDSMKIAIDEEMKSLPDFDTAGGSAD